MTFTGHMRLGSLEVVGALIVLSVVAARGRPYGKLEGVAVEHRVQLEVRELGTSRLVTAPLPLVIGRSPAAQVPVADAEVSRRHAGLDVERGILYVSDLRSSNGTFLNGERVGDGIEVRKGDHIDVGSTRITVLSASPWT